MHWSRFENGQRGDLSGYLGGGEQKGFPVALSPIAASSVRERVHLIASAVIPLTVKVLDPGSAKLRSLSHPYTMSVKSIHLARRKEVRR